MLNLKPFQEEICAGIVATYQIAGLFGTDVAPVLDATFDQLADAVEEHLDTDAIRSWIS